MWVFRFGVPLKYNIYICTFKPTYTGTRSQSYRFKMLPVRDILTKKFRLSSGGVFDVFVVRIVGWYGLDGTIELLFVLD